MSLYIYSPQILHAETLHITNVTNSSAFIRIHICALFELMRCSRSSSKRYSISGYSYFRLELRAITKSLPKPQGSMASSDGLHRTFVGISNAY